MPRKTDTIALNSPFLDRRIKLLPCQKERLKAMYQRGKSIRSMARMYQVDKRLIQFIIFPERAVKNKTDREIRGGWKQYYNKKENSQAIKEHRQYKSKIL